MKWILTQRIVAETTITTLWDTNLFRFYELKVKGGQIALSTGHANFQGSEARDFWTQLSEIVRTTVTSTAITKAPHRTISKRMLSELPNAQTD